MRNLRKGFLTGLGVMIAIFPAMAALADTAVTGVNHRVTADGSVEISLQTTGDKPEVSVFATETPARIILDLPNTDYTQATDPVSVGSGAVQQYSAVGAGGRTRLVVELSQPSAYDYSAGTGEVVLTVAGTGMAAAAGASSVAAAQTTSRGSGDFSVTGVDFRRGEDGQGRVIVSLDRPGANISIEEGAELVRLDIFNTSLPEHLRQRLDVVDFATPVSLIDATRLNNGVRIAMSVTGIYEHMVYQTGQDIVVEVSTPKNLAQARDEPELRFFEDKEYVGERVTFNFQNIPVRSVLQLIADVSDLNIVVADSVGGDIVMDARNLDKRENGNVIWIGPTQEIANREQQLLKAQQDRLILEPLQTVLIPMNYSKAVDMKELIDESVSQVDAEYGLLSERGSVTVDERTNTLLITDTAERIVELRELLTELDYAVRQVRQCAAYR
jgi:type IV pilus assembly protein PilQ